MTVIPLFRGRRLLLLLATAILWFGALGYRDLIDPDEGRYAEIPREMVATGDWVTPRLNGFKYFEKPALQYWATATAYELFGRSPATARLWTALLGFLCALLVWYVGWRLFGLAAADYALFVTLGGLLYAVMGHVLTLDMGVTAFIFAGLAALLLAQSERDRPRRLRNRMLAGWAALGLAVLSKGLIGLVLPAGAVLLYSLWQRDWTLWRRLHLGKGLLVALAIAAPWFLLVSARNPEFAHFFFIHEHFERYTTRVHHRDAPFYYFTLIFVAGALPWIASTLGALLRPEFSWRAGDGRFHAERFLWVFVLFVVGFFSLSDSKLPAYILPAMPAAALLAGKGLATHPHRLVFDGRLGLLLAAALAVAASLLPRLGSGPIPPELFEGYRWWLLAAALLLAGGSALLLRERLPPARRATLAALLFLMAWRSCTLGFQELSPSRSARQMADAIRAQGLDAAPVFAVDTYPQSLPFYLNKTLRLALFTGELEMGIRAEPQRWIATQKEFFALWRAQPQAVAVLAPENYQAYRRQGLPMRILYRGPRFLAVSRR